MQNPHPYIVHFPIALLSIGVLFDLIGILRSDRTLRRVGWWSLAIGVVGAAVAVASGLYAERTVAHVDAAHEVMERHEWAGIFTAVLFTALLIWRTWRRERLSSVNPASISYLLIGAIGVVGMFYGASLGGELVFEYGVGTALVTDSEGHVHEEGEDHSDGAGHDEGADHAEDDSADGQTSEQQGTSDMSGEESAARDVSTSAGDGDAAHDPSDGHHDVTEGDVAVERPPGQSPYVDLLNSPIRGLDPSDVQAMREGEGMGFAIPAEINRHPGPSHVIALEEPLELTVQQHDAIHAIEDEMRAQARELGAQILALESQLEEGFRTGRLEEARLDELTGRIGVLRGQLRATHLRAHLATRRILTEEQVDRYDELRGYSEAGSADATQTASEESNDGADDSDPDSEHVESDDHGHGDGGDSG